MKRPMTAKNHKPAILFHPLADCSRGMGHLFRCRMLYEHLAGDGSTFAAAPDRPSRDFLESSALPWRELSPHMAADALGLELAEIARQTGAEAVVLDCKDNSRELVLALRQNGLLVIDLEDTGAGRTEADILLDPHIQPGSTEADYSGRVECCFGPGWTLIDPVYAGARGKRNKKAEGELLKITVSLGGSDPAGLSSLVLKALNKAATELEIDIVLGPGADTNNLPSGEKHTVQIHRGLSSLAELLGASDVGIVSGGVTMFESLCAGAATVVVPQHEEQFVNACRLARRDALLVVPPPKQNGSQLGLELAIREITGNSGLRRKLSAMGMALVDGNGVERLVNRIGKLLNIRKKGSITADAV